MPDSRLKKPIFLDYLIQAFLIVFSVLLALFLDGYRNDIKEQRELRQALNNIVQETQLNKEIAAELVIYHGQVYTNLQAAIMTNKALDTLQTEFGFLNISKIAPQGVIQKFASQTAWETSKLNNTISRLDFKRLQLLSKTYTQQQLTFTPTQKILEILENPRGNVKESLASLSIQFREMRLMETLLLSHYDEVLKEFLEP